MHSFDVAVSGTSTAVISALPLLTLSFLQLHVDKGKLVIAFLFHVGCVSVLKYAKVHCQG